MVEYYEDVHEAVYTLDEPTLNDSSVLSNESNIMSPPRTTDSHTELNASVSSVSSDALTSATDMMDSQPWQVEQRAEIEQCSNFAVKTCGCKMADGKPCSSLFAPEYYIDIRAQASLLTRQQLDLALLGSVISTTAVDKDVVCGRHRPTKSQPLSTGYMHRGYQLCKNTYNFLYGLGKHQVPTITKNFISNGLEVRTHGNTKRAPHHTSSFSTIKNAIVFIQNYAEQNVILLLGCILYQKWDNIKLLPSTDSKLVINC